MTPATFTSKGQIIIPKTVRVSLKIKTGLRRKNGRWIEKKMRIKSDETMV